MGAKLMENQVEVWKTMMKGEALLRQQITEADDESMRARLTEVLADKLEQRDRLIAAMVALSRAERVETASMIEDVEDRVADAITAANFFTEQSSLPPKKIRRPRNGIEPPRQSRLVEALVYSAAAVVALVGGALFRMTVGG